MEDWQPQDSPLLLPPPLRLPRRFQRQAVATTTTAVSSINRRLRVLLAAAVHPVLQVAAQAQVEVEAEALKRRTATLLAEEQVDRNRPNRLLRLMLKGQDKRWWTPQPVRARVRGAAVLGSEQGAAAAVGTDRPL